MELMQVKSQIKSKNIYPMYIFTGDEIAVMDIYIKQIAKVKQIEIKRVDSIVDIYSKLRNKSFVNQSYCYVIRDDKEFMSNEKLWSEVPNIIGNNLVIFTATNMDKRGKFYKQFKDIIVQFEYLPENVLIKYIKKEVDLSDKYCKILIDICGQDYSRILLELNKMKHYQNSTEDSDGYKLVMNDVLKQLMKEGAIYIPARDCIFDCVDAIMKRRPQSAFRLLGESYESGENTLTLISVLYQDIRRTLQVQACESKDIAKSTGLTGWQIKNAQQHCGHYSNGDLVYMLKLVQKVERGIKTGLIDPDIAMEYILVHIF